MVAPATGCQSEYQEQDQLKYTQPKSSKLYCVPIVKTDEGELSVPAEIMVGVWQQIQYEGKKDLLFYDGGIKDLKQWLDYIYNPNNYVVLVANEKGHIHHIAWINKFYQGHGFLHHCSLGNYNRRTWPILKDYWQSMKNDFGEPIIKTLIGLTPVSNTLAVRLVKMLGWTILGEIPGVCFMAEENKYIPGVISYCVINEV